MPVYSLFSVLYLTGVFGVFVPYRNVARLLRALESASRSPLASYIVEVGRGRMTIRAFGALDFGLLRMSRLLENHIVLAYHMKMTVQWFATRLELLAGFTIANLALYLGAPQIKQFC